MNKKAHQLSRSAECLEAYNRLSPDQQRYAVGWFLADVGAHWDYPPPPHSYATHAGYTLTKWENAMREAEKQPKTDPIDTPGSPDYDPCFAPGDWVKCIEDYAQEDHIQNGFCYIVQTVERGQLGDTKIHRQLITLEGISQSLRFGAHRFEKHSIEPYGTSTENHKRVDAEAIVQAKQRVAPFDDIPKATTFFDPILFDGVGVEDEAEIEAIKRETRRLQMLDHHIGQGTAARLDERWAEQRRAGEAWAAGVRRNRIKNRTWVRWFAEWINYFWGYS